MSDTYYRQVGSNAEWILSVHDGRVHLSCGGLRSMSREQVHELVKALLHAAA